MASDGAGEQTDKKERDKARDSRSDKDRKRDRKEGSKSAKRAEKSLEKSQRSSEKSQRDHIKARLRAAKKAASAATPMPVNPFANIPSIVPGSNLLKTLGDLSAYAAKQKAVEAAAAKELGVSPEEYDRMKKGTRGGGGSGDRPKDSRRDPSDDDRTGQARQQLSEYLKGAPATGQPATGQPATGQPGQPTPLVDPTTGLPIPQYSGSGVPLSFGGSPVLDSSGKWVTMKPLNEMGLAQRDREFKASQPRTPSFGESLISILLS